MEQAEKEKNFAAEKNVALARTLVVYFNTLLFFFLDRKHTILWLGCTIIVIALTYSLYYLFFKPYKKYALLTTSVFSSVSDATLITLWLYATGSFYSPFYPLWYISILAIAFRFNWKATFLITVFYSLLYLVLLIITGGIADNEISIIIRIGYLFLISFLGSLITKETLIKTQEKVKMEDLAREAQESGEKLIKSQEMLREAQAIAHLGSWEWDVVSGKITWSDEVYKIFGIDRKDITYEEYLGFLHPDDRARAEKIIQQSYASLQPFSFDHRLIRPDGEVRILYSRGKAIKDEDTQAIKMLGTVLDITEIKNTKEELKLRDEFIGIASHELKTPLTSVKAYIQLLDRHVGHLDNKSKEFIWKANSHINRLNNLISDLLDVSKIQGGKLQYNITAFDFDEMIKEGVEGVQHTEPKHQIIVEGRANAIVEGDKNRIEQVLINFLTNAIKYSPEAKTVEVKVKREEDNITVAVTDYGIGISKRNLRKVFSKFYRVQDITHKFSGLGIGLFISSEIIKRHQGKIWVESTEGKGSTFYFSIKAKAPSD